MWTMTLERKWSFESMQHPVLAASILEKETISTPHVGILATPFYPSLICLKKYSGLENYGILGRKKMLAPVSFCTSNSHSVFALQGDLMSQNKAF